MHPPLKSYFKSAFIKVLTIVYLLFIIAYQLNVPTTAHFSSSDLYHGTLSAADEFQKDVAREESEDEPLEVEMDEQESNRSEEKKPEHPVVDEKEDVKKAEVQPHNQPDKEYMNESELQPKKQKQQPKTPTDESTEKTAEQLIIKPKEFMQEKKAENNYNNEGE